MSNKRDLAIRVHLATACADAALEHLRGVTSLLEGHVELGALADAQGLCRTLRAEIAAVCERDLQAIKPEERSLRYLTAEQRRTLEMGSRPEGFMACFLTKSSRRLLDAGLIVGTFVAEHEAWAYRTTPLGSLALRRWSYAAPSG